MLRSPTITSPSVFENRQCGVGAMTQNWLLRVSSSAPFRVACWNSARFGPIDTSYHEFSHKAGTANGSWSW